MAGEMMDYKEMNDIEEITQNISKTQFPPLAAPLTATITWQNNISNSISNILGTTQNTSF